MSEHASGGGPLERVDEHDGQLVRLVLSRPKANILDAEMVEAICGELGRLEGQAQLKVIVFEGAGDHFSFGASVEEHLPDRVASMLEGFHRMFRRLESLGVPTAAVVRGQCLGGGLELALFCGWVFCAPSARLALPEVKLGVFPPLGALVLPWRAGGGRATQLIVEGRTLDGETAARWNLVEQCSEDPQAALGEWFAREIAPKSAVGVRYAYQAARVGLAEQLQARLPKLEALYLDQLMKHDDPVEGLQAFLQRREPRWSNR